MSGGLGLRSIFDAGQRKLYACSKPIRASLINATPFVKSRHHTIPVLSRTFTADYAMYFVYQ
jgi:hypothetical protein